MTTMMMVKTIPYFPSCSTRLDLQCSKSSPRLVICSLRNYDSIPKRDHFSRSSLGDNFANLPLIQKAQKELTDYCTTLEGEECCRCWEAYFELTELEKVVPKRDLERTVTDTGGMKSLIRRIRGATDVYKPAKKENNELTKVVNEVKREETKKVDTVRTEERCPVPDGIPKSPEEMEEEEKWRWPDTAEIRMLRAVGGYPSWYVARPDHETD